MTTRKDLDHLSYRIIGAAIYVHRMLGPGLLEHAYETFFIDELVERGLRVSAQKEVTIEFNGREVESKLKYDLLVNDLIVVELKSIEKILPIHVSQLLTYMRILKKPKGILINFNCTNIFKYGQKTLVNKLYSSLPAS